MTQAYRYIYYVEQEADGTFRPFLQQVYDGGEHDGNVRWLDPGKSTYKTAEDAKKAAIELGTYGPDADVDMKTFAEAVETDIRLGKIQIDIKAGVSESTAYATEKQRVDTAITAKLAAEEELK